ncbi:MAG: type II toxin-antitoxin system RelE/ParE family toxin [Pseudomonadota bacterium]|mgnify:CR=1 FL=1
MLKIQLSKRAYKFFTHLPPKQTRQLKDKIQLLRADSLPPDSKQLVGYSTYHRVDVGEYRIIYKVESEVLMIILIGKRNDSDIYRRMKRLLKH